MKNAKLWWLVSVTAAIAITYCATYHFGHIRMHRQNEQFDDDDEMIVIAAVPTKRAGPHIDEAYFRKRIFGTEENSKQFPHASERKTILGYTGYGLSKKPVDANAFSIPFLSLW